MTRSRSVMTSEEYRALQVKSMSEDDLTRNVLDLCDALEIQRELRFHQYDSHKSTEGWFDWVFLIVKQERAMFRELKSGTGKLSPRQIAVIAAAPGCGAGAGG